MPEELKVDCFECKDLEFARNLSKSMKEGYGRHNSNRAFRNLGVSFSWPRDAAFLEQNQARVIGRFGERAIQARWEECAIGDCVAERHMPNSAQELIRTGKMRYFKAITPRRLPISFEPTAMPVSVTDRNTEERLFERVCTQMTADGGHTWDKHYFWKRIS